VSGVLGQVRADPIVPFRGATWSQSKAYVLSDLMGYRPYDPEVIRFHQSEARHLVLLAPARAGKSFTAAHDLVPYCLPTQPLLDSMHAIVGLDYKTAKEFDYLWNVFIEGRERWTGIQIERAQNNPRSGDREIVIDHGLGADGHRKRCIIRTLSASHEKSLQGEQWTNVLFSEAAEHDESVVSRYFGSRAWRFLYPTTPKPGAQWLRELSEKGESDPTLSVETFRIPKTANPLFDHEGFRREERLAELRARQRIGPEATAEHDPFFAEQFLGRWVSYTGRVLPFDSRRHVIPFEAVRPLLTRSEIWISIDYGYEDPASVGFWAITPRGYYVRFDEIYERHLSTPALVEKVQSRLESHGVQARLTTGDPSRPEVGRLFEDCGIPVVTIERNAQRDRAAGKRRLADLLVRGPDEGRPGLFVTDRCKHTIRTLAELSYRENVQEDSPRAFVGEDHAYDDCRYLVMSRPSTPRPAEESLLVQQIRQSRLLREATRNRICGTSTYGVRHAA